MSDRYPETLHRSTVARSRLFRIESVGLRFRNGVEVEYERLGGSAAGAVLVVPVNTRGEVLLIREYAAGTECYELGLPKGRVEPEEDPLRAANRELMEEVGYGAERLTVLRSVTLAPAYFSHRTQLILAEGLYEHPLPGDEPEPIEVVPWPLEELERLLGQADLTEARSITALFLARDHLAARTA
ncbi:MAG: ADP compounds hydrolase NudE [Halorhodospira halophila]|uniref:ADP compounds hydrolase NudE n=1 Tax=Halorhodospira TaxID=85108 RepID=UPI00191394BE|nr:MULTISPECIES: ADP compounds hydrolase NudE [Halorhodospira]MBK5944372.1 ADP compounds hydrolase NudE [Halorhodospira halophila]MCC3751753.1 ADP compounds hydrolase NudE [Halorhodospira halophila]MCG5527507.1 ADP compounds hydrolase NudE [Halorhodospira halophila]MCG5533536.1 ADP compounds hydrolase NudE [Halorhodospira sp. 9621]MCG5538404.1 ADP compounds hydrolase NudE [Halorhodospira sp. 9622]